MNQKISQGKEQEKEALVLPQLSVPGFVDS